MSESTTTALEQLEARVRISELIARYSHAIDRGEREDFAALWHPDVTYTTAGTTYHGVQETLSVAEGLWDSGGQSWHLPANTVIEFTSESTATATSTIAAIATGAGDTAQYYLGSYLDTFERRDGVWLFSSRVVEINRVGTA